LLRFAALHEFQNLHAKSKDKITSFLQGHFCGHLDFELDNTLYFFLAGRYECAACSLMWSFRGLVLLSLVVEALFYLFFCRLWFYIILKRYYKMIVGLMCVVPCFRYRNKGVDLFIEALARLNHQLRSAGSKTTVVAFIIMPARTNNYNVDSLRGQATVKRLVDTVAELKTKIGQKIFDSVSTGGLPAAASLLDTDDIVRLKRCIYAAQHPSLPPVVTHNVVDDSTDQA